MSNGQGIKRWRGVRDEVAHVIREADGQAPEVIAERLMDAKLIQGIGRRAGAPRAKKPVSAEMLTRVLAIVTLRPGVLAGEVQKELREQGVPFRSGDHSRALAELMASGRIVRTAEGPRARHSIPDPLPERG